MDNDPTIESTSVAHVSKIMWYEYPSGPALATVTVDNTPMATTEVVVSPSTTASTTVTATPEPTTYVKRDADMRSVHSIDTLTPVGDAENTSAHGVRNLEASERSPLRHFV